MVQIRPPLGAKVVNEMSLPKPAASMGWKGLVLALWQWTREPMLLMTVQVMCRWLPRLAR